MFGLPVRANLHCEVCNDLIGVIANADETPLSLEPLAKKTLDVKGVARPAARVRGRYRDHNTAYLSFLIEVSKGVNQGGDLAIILGTVHRPAPALVWKGQREGKSTKR